VGDDDLLFVWEAGGFVDGSALRRRYKPGMKVKGKVVCKKIKKK